MDDAAESLSIPAQTVYGKLRGRAALLRRWSAVFLGLALAALGAGAWFAIEAQRLTLGDVRAAGEAFGELIQGKEAEIAGIDAEIANLGLRQAGIKDRIKQDLAGGHAWFRQDSKTNEHLFALHVADDKRSGWVVGTGGTILAKRAFPEASAALEPLGTFEALIAFVASHGAPPVLRGRGYEAQLTSLKDEAAANRDRKATLQNEVKVLRSQLHGQEGGDRWSFTFATNATRVAVILITLFLVQILVSLYRYNTRLAGYYDARADALLLLHAEESNVKDMPFGELMAALSPDAVDFGRTAKTSVDHAVEMAKEVMRVDRRGRPG